jgi:hypothetical protein
MPVGEFIAECLIRPVLEIVIGGFSYLTGALFLKVVSIGQIDLAPMDSIHERNRMPKGQRDWSIWLRRPGKRSALKMEVVCMVGFLVWGVIGLCIYQATKDGEPREKTAVPAVAE